MVVRSRGHLDNNSTTGAYEAVASIRDRLFQRQSATRIEKMGGRKPSPRSVVHQPTPLGRLVALERRYPIDRPPLQEALRRAIADQRSLDEFMKDNSHDAGEWARVARRWDDFASQANKATDLLVGLVSSSRLDQAAKAHFASRLFTLREELAPTMKVQAAAARFMATLSLPSLTRRRGRPGAGIVNACLSDLVEDLAGQHIPKEQCLAYVAALAQVEGVIAEDARAPISDIRNRTKRTTHRQKLQALKSLQQAYLASPMSGVAGKTVAEAATQARLIAQGHWPEDLQRSFPSDTDLENGLLATLKSRK